MHALNIEDYGFSPMSAMELTYVEGGITPYEVGHFIGECILVIAIGITIFG